MTGRRFRTGLAGFVLNPPEGSVFVDIGKFIANFSAVEFMSYVWITELSTDDAVLECCVDMPISRRFPVIDFLVQRTLMPEAWKREVTELWSKAKALSEDRNLVAHTPILFVWEGKPAQGQADVVGIPNLRHLKEKYGGKLPIADTLAIRPRVDEAVRIFQELQLKLEAFRAQVDAAR